MTISRPSFECLIQSLVGPLTTPEICRSHKVLPEPVGVSDRFNQTLRFRWSIRIRALVPEFLRFLHKQSPTRPANLRRMIITSCAKPREGADVLDRTGPDVEFRESVYNRNTECRGVSCRVAIELLDLLYNVWALNTVTIFHPIRAKRAIATDARASIAVARVSIWMGFEIR